MTALDQRVARPENISPYLALYKQKNCNLNELLGDPRRVPADALIALEAYISRQKNVSEELKRDISALLKKIQLPALEHSDASHLGYNATFWNATNSLGRILERIFPQEDIKAFLDAHYSSEQLAHCKQALELRFASMEAKRCPEAKIPQYPSQTNSLLRFL